MFLLNREDNPVEHDERAEEHFREVLRIQESERRDVEHNVKADALNGLGVLYIHQKRYGEALAVLEGAAGDLFNRQAYMAWGNIGWAHLESRQYPKAIEALSRAVKLSPQFCVGHFRLGQAYLATEALEDAERALTSAIEADERCASFQDAWHLRGEARMKLGTREDARADFERCVELGPNTETGKACGRYLEATY
jgi:Tfp pilus assembly protein PilF